MFVLISIGILALLILVHEAGHFAAAKLQGIHVNRFSLGFGPAIWRFQGEETEYAVRALPLGGFVGFPDEDEDCPYPKDDPDLLKNRPVGDRLVVMSAGVLANLVFAYITLATMFVVVGIPTVEPGILIPKVVEESPAEVAGIKAGDIILAAEDQNYQELTRPDEARQGREAFQTLIHSHRDQPVTLTIQRDDQLLDLTVIPRSKTAEGEGMIGVGLDLGELTFRPAVGIQEILSESTSEYQQVVMANVQGFRQLIQNFQATASQVSGPVGIVKLGADLAESDSTRLFDFTALISINLAILNLLPLPALDGGHIAFLLLEALRGKRLPKQFEDRVMQTGLVLLLGLGVVLIFKDTIALVSGAG